jgi:uncharacterized protein YjiS (DUF1127 family)
MSNIRCSALERPAAGAPGSARGLVSRLVRLPLAILETLLVWQERHRQRRHLASLDDRLLSDMGISRAEAERESAIPFWRVS